MPISTAEPITWSAGVLKKVIVHNHAQPHNVNRIPSTMDNYTKKHGSRCQASVGENVRNNSNNVLSYRRETALHGAL